MNGSWPSRPLEFTQSVTLRLGIRRVEHRLAGGRNAAIVIGGRGLTGPGDGFGCRIESLNQ